MGCRICSDSLSAFIDGELEPSERESVEEHLRQCADCKREYESLLYFFEMTDAMSDRWLKAPAFAGIEARIDRGSRGLWDFRWLFTPAWATLAAGLLLATSIPFYLDSNDEQARLERQFAHFVEQRDRQESLHHGIIRTEPVGWVTYNPFTLDRAPTRSNPFSE